MGESVVLAGVSIVVVLCVFAMVVIGGFLLFIQH
jgi:hypothetical protein